MGREIIFSKTFAKLISDCGGWTRETKIIEVTFCSKTNSYCIQFEDQLGGDFYIKASLFEDLLNIANKRKIKHWLSGIVYCEVCTRKWEAVWPKTSCDKLQCPACRSHDTIILEQQ